MQVKKEGVASALRNSAAELFAAHGWHGTTMAAVARRAGVSAGTAYVYFPSKFALLLAVYEPWLREGVEGLRREVRRRRTPEARLASLLQGLLQRIPRERGAFAATVMGAIGSVGPGEYTPDLGRWLEGELSSLLDDCIGHEEASARRGRTRLLLLAFDGAAVRARLDPSADDAAALDALASALMPREIRPGRRGTA